MQIVKVSIENKEGKNTVLYDLDLDKSLEENMANIRAKFEMPSKTHAFGLKLLSTNSGECIDHFITDENIKEIKDGYFLKVVYSIEHSIATVFKLMDRGDIAGAFSNLYQLALDPAAVKQLTKDNKYLVLMDHLTVSQQLYKEQIISVLLTVIHLIKMDFDVEITEEFLNRLFEIINSERSPEEIQITLSLLHKMLISKKKSIKQWREKIVGNLKLEDIWPFLWSEDDKTLQFRALLLINTIVRSCKPEKHLDLIRHLNEKGNRYKIYKYVIMNKKVDPETAHELYVYQTLMFGKYAEAYKQTATIDNALFNSEMNIDVLRPLSHVEEFQENEEKIQLPKENFISQDNESARFSLLSLLSQKTVNTIESMRFSDCTLVDGDEKKVTICSLTWDGICYFKKNYSKNFKDLLTEELYHHNDILLTAERVMKIICKLLHIGKDPDKTTTIYQPAAFECSEGADEKPFLFEMFSRGMWTLLKTRRDMKACSSSDHKKVLKILEKQIKMVLESKPINLKQLTKRLMETTYEEVVKRWEEEKEREFNNMLENNPAILELKEHYSKENHPLVFKKRTMHICNGDQFTRIQLGQKKTEKIFLKVSKNHRDLYMYKYDKVKQVCEGNPEIYNISNITHIVTGNSCQHAFHSEAKDINLIFSIVIDNGLFINLVAEEANLISYWLDGMQMITGIGKLTEAYNKELAELVKMDIRLRLLELQNVTIPKRPPPVPQPPSMRSSSPQLPPKPDRRNSSATHTMYLTQLPLRLFK